MEKISRLGELKEDLDNVNDMIIEAKACQVQGNLTDTYKILIQAHAVMNLHLQETPMTDDQRKVLEKSVLEVFVQAYKLKVVTAHLQEEENLKKQLHPSHKSDLEFKKSLKLPFNMKKRDEKSDEVSALTRIIWNLEVSRPTVPWEDIIGQENVKKIIRRQIIKPQLLPEIYSKSKIANGIILFGPPGNGKTTIAKAAAAASKRTFFKISISQLASKWSGMTEQTISQVFKIAEANQPSILFFDEVEALIQDREENAASKIVTTMLDESTTRKGIFVIAATNCPWDIDQAFFRRWPPVHVTMPTAMDRLNMIKLQLKEYDNIILSREMTEIANMTKGYSFDDIRAIFMSAMQSANDDISEGDYYKTSHITAHGKLEYICACSKDDPNARKMKILEKGKNQLLAKEPMSMKHVIAAMKEFTPTVSTESIEKSKAFAVGGQTAIIKMKKEKEKQEKIKMQKEIIKASSSKN